MTTTPDALAADYVGRHRLSPELSADMTTELTEFVTWTSGKAETAEERDRRLLMSMYQN